MCCLSMLHLVRYAANQIIFLLFRTLQFVIVFEFASRSVCWNFDVK